MKNFAVPFALALSLPGTAFALSTFKDLANTIVGIINAGIILLITATVVLFMGGAVKKIFDQKGGKAEDMTGFLWKGVGIIFVMVSIWGIINIIQYTLFGSPQQANNNYDNVSYSP